MAQKAASPHPPVEEHQDGEPLRREEPSFLSKLSYAGYVYGTQSLTAPFRWVEAAKEQFGLPKGGPNFVKAYDARPYLPAR